MYLEVTYRGHVKNGQITLDEPAQLPEGTEVNIEVVCDSRRQLVRQRRSRRTRPEPDLARQIAALGDFHPSQS